MRVDEVLPQKPLTPAQAANAATKKLRKQAKVQRDIADIRASANDRIAKKQRAMTTE